MKSIYFIWLSMFLQSTYKINGVGNSGIASDKPVKINLNEDTGLLFLNRAMQVVTVILLMIILLLLIVTIMSVIWYCCIQKKERNLSKELYDSVSTKNDLSDLQET
eukprot:UN07705